MNISGINNPQFTKSLDAINAKFQTGKTDGISGKVAIEDENIVITVKDSRTGNVRQTALIFPELDEVENSLDVAQVLEAVSDKIEDFVQDLKALYAEIEREISQQGAVKCPKSDNSTVSSAGAQKTIFNIMEILTLMQNIGILQREIARNVRFSELKAEVSAIEHQAEHQRKAAMLGLIVSAATCLAQVGMLCMAAYKAGAAQKAANNTAANQQLKTAQSDVKTLSHAENPEALKSDLDSAKSKLSDSQIQKLDGELRAAWGKHNDHVEAFNKEHGKQYADLKQETAKLKGDLQKLDIEVQINSNKLSSLKSSPTKNVEAEGKLQKTVDDLKSQKTDLESQIGAKEEEIHKLDQEKVDAEAKDKLKDLDSLLHKKDLELDAVRAQTMEKEDAAIKAYDKKGVLGKLKNLFVNDEAENIRNDSQKAVADLSAERDYLRAKVTQMKTGMGKIGMESIELDSGKAHHNFNKFEHSLGSNRAYAANMASVQKWGQLAQSVQMCNNFCQSFTVFVERQEEVKATVMQADQKRAEQFREETAQLMSSAQSILDNALQVFKATIEAEDRTIQSIMS